MLRNRNDSDEKKNEREKYEKSYLCLARQSLCTPSALYPLQNSCSVSERNLVAFFSLSFSSFPLPFYFFFSLFKNSF